MPHSLRIAVADDEPLMRMYLEDMLPDFGHEVVASAEDGADLVRQVHKHQPDLVITDVRMPRMDGIEALQELCRERPLPVVFITGYDERERFATVERHCIPVYLRKPVDMHDVQMAIASVMEQFDEFCVLQAEEPDQDAALGHRSDVEQAKSILTERENLSRTEAFERLRDVAAQRGMSLVEAARAILTDARPGANGHHS